MIVLDFETYYDKEYSLKKITPAEYILDPRFEVTGCAVIDPRFPDPVFMEEHQFRKYISVVKAERKPTRVLSHNALFDMCILSWHYDYVPTLMVDTQGMARALLYYLVGYVSLEKIAEHLKLPPKGKTIHNVAGMNAASIKAAGLWPAYAAYACHDAWLCKEIYKRLAPHFPTDEFFVMDMVLRCAVEPKFKLDTELLAEHMQELAAQKQALLSRCGVVSVAELMSNDKFAQALRNIGIEPPMKTSPTTGKQTYAFAKSDPGMIELSEHEREDVQALVAARVGHKSTLAETRATRLYNISLLPWPGNKGQGWGPIPLRYGGAHTHRLSGDWKLNPQNWAKFSVNADGTKETGKLRRAHVAPPGHKVVKRDASQIEARIVAWLAGQHDLVKAFAKGEDIYSDFAQNNIYHYPVNKQTVDERFVGKNAILGLGFGLGKKKFQKDTAAKSFTQMGRTIIIDLPTSGNIVGAYRTRFSEIPKAWRFLDTSLPMMTREGTHIPFGPVELRHESILLPNGLSLFYRNLTYDPKAGDGTGQWVCLYGKRPKFLYGAKVFENIVQALARILTMGAALRMQRTYPHFPRLAHQIHDDLVYIVPDAQVREVDEALAHFMNDTPDWAAGLPLASEGGIGQNYGDAK